MTSELKPVTIPQSNNVNSVTFDHLHVLNLDTCALYVRPILNMLNSTLKR